MKLIIYIIFLTVQVSFGVIYRLNDTEYLRMPPLYHLDDYESCLHQTNGTYCYVEMDLVSDTPSDLLHMIHEYSKHTTNHFNNSRLQHGICLTKTCKDFLQQNKEGDPKLVLERCLNESLWKDYNLKSRVTKMTNCKKLDDPMIITTGDICAAAFFACLALLNIVGSLYDSYIVRGGKGHVLLLSFSLKRNYDKLVKKGPSQDRLEGINGVRAISMTIILFTHAMIPLVSITENPHSFEKTYHNILYQIFYNGTVIVQVFFVISGCLLTYNIRKCYENGLSWTSALKKMLQRWSRLTPAYAVVLIFTLTWNRFMGSGPFWELFVGAEVADCQRNWWWNMLYLNNYIENTQCMIHTWFVAADMQLYILGLFVCVLGKSARSRNIVLTTLFIVGIAIIAIVTYLLDLDATIIIGPEMLRKFSFDYSTFNYSYKPGHTNIPSTVLGLALGNLIYEGLKDEEKISKLKKLGILYSVSLPLGVILPLTGMVFYGDRPRLSIYIRVALAVLLKSLFSFLIVIFIIGIVFKFQNVYRRITEWPGWSIPAQISYSAYIINFSIIRIFVGMKRTLYHVGVAELLKSGIGIVVITGIIAYPFWLFVEAPLNEAVPFILGLSKKDKNGGKNKQQTDDITKGNNHEIAIKKDDNKPMEINMTI